jgi:hypothetical protein
VPLALELVEVELSGMHVPAMSHAPPGHGVPLGASG